MTGDRVGGTGGRAFRFQRSIRTRGAIAPGFNGTPFARPMFMDVHDAVVRILAGEDLGPVFTLMSEGTMRLMAELETGWADDVPMIKTRHEQGAVAMADGYARATGDVGVCLLGRGPAVSQTGNAMLTARKHGSDLLVITTESPQDERYDIKAFDQTGYLHSTIGEVVSIRHPAVLVSEFREAIRRVRVGAGPLAVQIPWDVLDGPLSRAFPESYQSSTAVVPEENVTTGVQPDPTSIAEAVERYLDADAFQPPVILAGGGAVAADARPAIESLAERTSALLATTIRARDLFADHPFALGVTGEWGSDLANRYAAEADLVVAVGASLNPYTTDDGHVFGEDTTIIHIDEDPGALDRHTSIALGIRGDARLTVEAIEEGLADRGVDRAGELWTDARREEIGSFDPMRDRNFPTVDGTLDPRALVRRLDAVLPADRKLVVDAGHFTRWCVDAIRAPPEDFTFTLDFASIGLGLPQGIGTAAASDEPVVTVCGDAGFMMSVQEVETAARNDIGLTIVVMNDDSLGSEYHSLDVDGEPPEVGRVPAPEIADVAGSLGARATTVRSLDDLEAIADLLGAPQEEPFVVDCKVNPLVRHRSKQ